MCNKTETTTQEQTGKIEYDVISPDGFSIMREGYFPTQEDAKDYLKQWIKQYERQGYYSSCEGRISLEDLEKYCEIVPVVPGIEEEADDEPTEPF